MSLATDLYELTMASSYRALDMRGRDVQLVLAPVSFGALVASRRGRAR